MKGFAPRALRAPRTGRHDIARSGSTETRHAPRLKVDHPIGAGHVDTSVSWRRVTRELSALVATRGSPGMIVSDHGTEFTSNAMLEWTQKTGRALAFHRAGKADAKRDLVPSGHSIPRIEC